MEKLRIFISSTMEDLKDERIALARAINQNQFWEAVYAEVFIARSESPREVCLGEVRNSHIYICIFKNRYGYVLEDDNPRRISVVNLEYEEAKNNQLPIFIFVFKNATDREPRLDGFLQEITNFDKGSWKKECSNVDELVQFALEAINRQVTKNCVEAINAKRNYQIKNIYNLPYFKRIKEKL